MVIGFVEALQKCGLAKLPWSPEGSTASAELAPSARAIPPTILDLQDSGSTETVTIPCSLNVKYFTIRLAAGELRFSSDDIPGPPPAGIPFVVETLAQQWDDTSVHWLGVSPLIIKSTPIALKYWKDIFGRGQFSAVWTRIKQTWHRWKVGVPPHLSPPSDVLIILAESDG